MEKRKDRRFDCIAFKREVQARMYEETRNLSSEQLLEYFRRKVEEGPFAEYFEAVQDKEEAA
jgi:hypothetical protein